MTVYRLDNNHIGFPPPSEADPDGLLAVGGDLRPERLVLAYATGIFPWPHEGLPLLWFSPDPRTVLPPDELHVPRRLRRRLRQGEFEVRLDTDFRGVIERCAAVERKHEAGTWITSEMIEAYTVLHELGLAHSAEAWQDGRLVGGLYGVALGGVFTGESMFYDVSNASKVALATLVRQLERWGFVLLDAQIHTEHVARFGARRWPRSRYLATLRRALLKPTRWGAWQLDNDIGW